MSDTPTVWGVHMGVHVGTEPVEKKLHWNWLVRAR